MSEVFIRYQSEGGIATITIDRPAKRNALSVDVCDQLASAWKRFAEGDDRIAILTASNDVAFTAGADLNNPPPRFWEAVPGVGIPLDKPVISAVSGLVIGAGILLVAIKPAAVGDYETVIQTVQEALAKDTDPDRVAAAKGWHVYKAAENDAKGNALYIHVMQPTVKGFDYRLSLLLDELIKDLAPQLLVRYQEAFAVPSTRLNLTEFANMSMAPVPAAAPPAAPTEKKPGG